MRSLLFIDDILFVADFDVVANGDDDLDHVILSLLLLLLLNAK